MRFMSISQYQIFILLSIKTRIETADNCEIGLFDPLHFYPTIH